MPTFLPGSEADRFAARTRCAVLDTPPEEDFERITSLAADQFDVPVTRISFVDETRVWFKSSCGASAIDRHGCAAPRPAGVGGRAHLTRPLKNAALAQMVDETPAAESNPLARKG